MNPRYIKSLTFALFSNIAQAREAAKLRNGPGQPVVSCSCVFGPISKKKRPTTQFTHAAYMYNDQKTTHFQATSQLHLQTEGNRNTRTAKNRRWKGKLITFSTSLACFDYSSTDPQRDVPLLNQRASNVWLHHLNNDQYSNREESSIDHC